MRYSSVVIAGLDPAIHPSCKKMDARVKPAHDGRRRLAGGSVQSVDLLIADIDWLITIDTERRIIRDAAVAVDQGRIVAIGKSAEIAKRFTGRQLVDGRRTVATPGFVDCHLHSSFALSRGLADEANAQSFLFDRMYPYEAALEGDDVRISATLAAAELLKHGVTCFIDPGNYHPEASVEGVMSTGIRASCRARRSTSPSRCSEFCRSA